LRNIVKVIDDLVEYLNSKGLSLGNKVLLQVGVPEWIWTKEEYIKACIRGLVDTENYKPSVKKILGGVA